MKEMEHPSILMVTHVKLWNVQNTLAYYNVV
jgi:hypothetical protein